MHVSGDCGLLKVHLNTLRETIITDILMPSEEKSAERKTLLLMVIGETHFFEIVLFPDFPIACSSFLSPNFIHNGMLTLSWIFTQMIETPRSISPIAHIGAIPLVLCSTCKWLF
jgi:hypothetical protein